MMAKSSKVFSDEDTDDSACSFLNLCESNPSPASQTNWSEPVGIRSLLYQVPDLSEEITLSLQNSILDDNRIKPGKDKGFQNTSYGPCSNEQTSKSGLSAIGNHEEIGICDISNKYSKEISPCRRLLNIDINEEKSISKDDNDIYETIKFRGRRFRKKKLKRVEQTDDTNQFPSYYSVETIFPDTDVSKRSIKEGRLNLPAIDISPSDQDNSKNKPRVSGGSRPFFKERCVDEVENNYAEIELMPSLHYGNNLSPRQASPELLTPSTLTPGNQSPLSCCSETSPLFGKLSSSLVDEQSIGGLLQNVKQTRRRHNLLPPLNYRELKNASQNREDDVKNNERRTEAARKLYPNDKKALPLHLIPGKLLRNNLLPPLRYRDSTSSADNLEQCDDEPDFYKKLPITNRSKREKRQLSSYFRPVSPVDKSYMSVSRERLLASIAKSDHDFQMLSKNENFNQASVGFERKRSSVSSNSRKSSRGENSKKEKKGQRKRNRSEAEARIRNDQPGKLSNQCPKESKRGLSGDDLYQSNSSISKSTDEKHAHAQRYNYMHSEKTISRKYSFQTSRKKSFTNAGKGISQQNNVLMYYEYKSKSENDEKTMNDLNKRPPHLKTGKRKQFSKMISKDSIGTVKDSEHGSLTSKDSSNSSIDVNPRTPSSCGTES